MKTQQYNFLFDMYRSIDELNADDAALLLKARETTSLAYAPYSQFNVAAAAKLANGQIVTGTNQENASYPVGICAERVLLSTAASMFPGVALLSMAISYKNQQGISNHPISPCGICRQSLVEYEERMQQPIKIILSGLNGEVCVISNAKQLLPLTFTGEDLKK
jgi:cytidine deaminase